MASAEVAVLDDAVDLGRDDRPEAAPRSELGRRQDQLVSASTWLCPLRGNAGQPRFSKPGLTAYSGRLVPVCDVELRRRSRYLS